MLQSIVLIAYRRSTSLHLILLILLTVIDMLSDRRYNIETTTIRIKNKPKNLNYQMQENNLIEKYLQSVLKPLNMMQGLFFCAKYKIKEDLIIQICLKDDVISTFGTVIYISGILYFLFSSSFLIIEEKGCNFVYYGSVNDVVVFVTGSVLNYFTNIMQKNFF